MRRTLTSSLVVLIAASYLIQLLIPGYEEKMALNRILVDSGEYYRLVTVALVHGGFLHLGFNLYALHILGVPVEAYFGKFRYSLILATSLLGGSLLSIYTNPVNVFSIGASGMIFGLFASLALIGKRVGVEWRSILVVVGINFALGFMIGGVDWHSHLGGLIGGMVTTVILNPKN